MLLVFDSLVNVEQYKLPVNAESFQDFELDLNQSDFAFIDVFGKFTGRLFYQ